MWNSHTNYVMINVRGLNFRIFYLRKRQQSRFSQSHKVGNVGIIANFVLPYICSLLLFLGHFAAGKRQIKCQWVQYNCISRFNILLVWYFSNGTAKTKLAILAFLYCGVFVKNSNVDGAVKIFISRHAQKLNISTSFF